jgi:hypothetical protein
MAATVGARSGGQQDVERCRAARSGWRCAATGEMGAAKDGGRVCVDGRARGTVRMRLVTSKAHVLLVAVVVCSARAARAAQPIAAAPAPRSRSGQVPCSTATLHLPLSSHPT